MGADDRRFVADWNQIFTSCRGTIAFSPRAFSRSHDYQTGTDYHAGGFNIDPGEGIQHGQPRTALQAAGSFLAQGTDPLSWR